MSWTPEHKARSRERILSTASRLFAQLGFDSVSIDQVMNEAGMTRGAFYAHFASKSELYGEAILAAARTSRDTRMNCDGGSDMPLETLVNAYLSREHLSGDSLHCPLAFLVSDIAQRDDRVRDVWTQVFRGLVKIVQGQQRGLSDERAMQQVVMMVGGVAIARALNDDTLAQNLLATCRNAILDDVNPAASGDDHADSAEHNENEAEQIA